MNNGDEIQVVAVHRAFLDPLDYDQMMERFNGQPVISATQLVEYLPDAVHTMRVVDKENG